jgi:hypothetical protein
MTERGSLYRVVLETDMEDLPEGVQGVLQSALGFRGGLRLWDDVPGLLCVVSSSMEGEGTPYSWGWWSRIHGYLNGDPDIVERLARFERDFLPFVLDRAETCAVRVRVAGGWSWWPGETVEDLHMRMTAILVMES